MKRFLNICISILLFAGYCYSADIIILKDRTRIDVQIIDINEKEIRYKLPTMPEGPIYVLETKEINSVIYENGLATSFVKQPRTNLSRLVGLTLGAGFSFLDGYHQTFKAGYHYPIFPIVLGLDAAWEVHPKLDLGFYLHPAIILGEGMKYRGPSFGATTGILMGIMPKPNSGKVLLGLGSGIKQEPDWSAGVPIELRLGRILKNGFYFSFDFSVDIVDIEHGYIGGVSCEMGVHAGYNFMNKRSKSPKSQAIYNLNDTITNLEIQKQYIANIVDSQKFANDCYIAYLKKSNIFKSTTDKSLLESICDVEHTRQLLDEHDASWLEQNAKGYDKRLEQYLLQVVMPYY